MKIVYWSGTGNTQKMANLIAEGIIEKGKAAELINVSDANPDIFKDEDIVILGCPAMGDEILEEDEFEPFIEEISSKVSGKKVALFGSYGWGDGTWLRNFEERMISYGCQSTLDLLMVENEPEGSSEEECREFGRKIASL
ncbi:flavodoxin [Clostridium sp. SHJSY1]|uniref:flavodoxin n=1 Tax=Clostridium sp. SHJSY1 TaxID=2942483 RepID=UPI0028771BFC|nr:flavodoxin [Clostridium sp. SHJSY1]MDS0526611.1 flavodoxin [Clostridium sp. SHJSY1]